MGTMQKKIMKNDENGQLSCGIYSSPAAARPPLQGWVGDRYRDRSIKFLYKIRIQFELEFCILNLMQI